MTEFREDDSPDSPDPFPPDCDARTRKWLGRLAKAVLAFVTVPENIILAYSVTPRKDADPADPKSAWAIRFCEAAGERVGGHRDGERIYKGYQFHISGFVNWLFEKGYYDVSVDLDLSARRSDGEHTPHLFISGFKKTGRPFAVVLHTTPHPDVPVAYKVSENEQDDEGK